MNDWKPGDVAQIAWTNYGGKSGGNGIATPCEMDVDGCWYHLSSGWHIESKSVTDVRPLVVIDPASLARPKAGGDDNYTIADFARTLRLIANAECERFTTYRAEIVREVADLIDPPKPPRPDEPQDWLAAVEDAEGRRWFSHGSGWQRWQRTGDGLRADYADIDVVRVLSDGVRP